MKQRKAYRRRGGTPLPCQFCGSATRSPARGTLSAFCSDRCRDAFWARRDGRQAAAAGQLEDTRTEPTGILARLPWSEVERRTGRAWR